ncbi:MAG TPA: hypothetical protein VNL73_00035 [Verrucomicrobiae bacterium]|nr:hypothetical protein [Verrucomicrobiae bacterium]
MRQFKLACLLGISLILGSTASAAVPALVNFQGILRDSTGNPVPDGSYTVTFRIYTDSTAGSLLWDETQTVTTTNGLYNVLLGNLFPLDASVFIGFSPVFYLGTAVGSDPEMSPRTRLTSTPFALISIRSNYVGTIQGATGGSVSGDVAIGGNLSTTGNVGIGTTTPSELLDVRGNVKIGNAGQWFAAGGDENLRIIRGSVSDSGTIDAGSGFTVFRPNPGIYVISFTTPFSGVPTPVVSKSLAVGGPGTIATHSATATSFIVETRNDSQAFNDAPFYFIVAGPR